MSLLVLDLSKIHQIVRLEFDDRFLLSITDLIYSSTVSRQFGLKVPIFHELYFLCDGVHEFELAPELPMKPGTSHDGSSDGVARWLVFVCLPRGPRQTAEEQAPQLGDGENTLRPIVVVQTSLWYFRRGPAAR